MGFFFAFMLSDLQAMGIKMKVVDLQEGSPTSWNIYQTLHGNQLNKDSNKSSSIIITLLEIKP